nr:A24 family peptidase [Microbacterium amylolyticum]
MPADVFLLITQTTFFCVSARLIYVDVMEHRLPNIMVLPLTAGVVIALLILSLATADLGALVRSVAGGIALGGFYLLLRAGSRGALGGGDVKLAIPLGLLLAWDGWAALVVGAGLAFVLGGIASVVLLLARLATRGTHIAFGPWMLIGACLGLALT